MKRICVVGGGLAGSEFVLQLASRGVNTTVFEPRLDPDSGFSDMVHKTAFLAELVCSNSLRGMGLHSAPGLLKEELKVLSSFLIDIAYKNAVPAGTSLAVDRLGFPKDVTEMIFADPRISVIKKEINDLAPLFSEYDYVVLATGPLTSGLLSLQIQKMAGSDYLYFYDAIAPVLSYESINMDICYKTSRYGKGNGDDYINAPMDRDEYYNFIEELKNGEKVPLHEGDKGVFFRGCMPVEVMAGESDESLLFGPMRADGLYNERDDKQPYAVIQLRQDDLKASMFNMVGFQTRLTYGEQERIFKKVPGLENAEFLRHGSMHRNTYVNTPSVLNEDMSFKSNPKCLVAGQLSGVEGYIESIAHGLYVSRCILNKLGLLGDFRLPQTTAIGSLVSYILKANADNFQPVKMNFGLLSPLSEDDYREYYKGKKKRDKSEIKIAQSRRALEALKRAII